MSLGWTKGISEDLLKKILEEEEIIVGVDVAKDDSRGGTVEFFIDEDKVNLIPKEEPKEEPTVNIWYPNNLAPKEEQVLSRKSIEEMQSRLGELMAQKVDEDIMNAYSYTYSTEEVTLTTKSRLQETLEEEGLTEEEAVLYLKSMKVARRRKEQRERGKQQKEAVRDRAILL